ncbi:hypothetical protein AU099_gp71 [Gordonia phage GTE8]|uniref:Uncharacterized protein n=1 Tax=Gordonia phage GTE8 TaxID=1647475 RepID=A0A0K0N667_9CAUD|nr:hypothetical protein AU099_gp71 [Gordonia phage GTE8]AKJ72414.1 hypothetical protein GTE8_71 [Gordonia phage GTE8]
MTVTKLPTGAYVGIDDDDRAGRIAYLERPRDPRENGDHYRTPAGYARCYRCENSATRFAYLAISSLTPVCADHLALLVVERDRCGSTVERIQTTEHN